MFYNFIKKGKGFKELNIPMPFEAFRDAYFFQRRFRWLTEKEVKKKYPIVKKIKNKNDVLLLMSNKDDVYKEFLIAIINGGFSFTTVNPSNSLGKYKKVKSNYILIENENRSE